MPGIYSINRGIGKTKVWKKRVTVSQQDDTQELAKIEQHYQAQLLSTLSFKKPKKLKLRFRSSGKQKKSPPKMVKFVLKGNKQKKLLVQKNKKITELAKDSAGKALKSKTSLLASRNRMDIWTYVAQELLKVAQKDLENFGAAFRLHRTRNPTEEFVTFYKQFLSGNLKHSKQKRSKQKSDKAKYTVLARACKKYEPRLAIFVPNAEGNFEKKNGELTGGSNSKPGLQGCLERIYEHFEYSTVPGRLNIDLNEHTVVTAFSPRKNSKGNVVDSTDILQKIQKQLKIGKNKKIRFRMANRGTNKKSTKSKKQ